MSTPQPQPFDHQAAPARVDAALRQTVALLELVRQEEALLSWLNQCVSQLQAVHRARQHLLDVTDAELAEAEQHAADATTTFPGSTSTQELGS
jgi:hypothetical protein